MRIHAGVAATPLFRVDVPSSSQSVRFCTELTRTETDDEIKSGEKLGPASLATGKEFSSAEIFQVLVVGDDVDRRRSSLKVVAPSLESFKNCQEFLIVDVVVEFGGGKRPGVESDRMNFVGDNDGKDGTEGVVRGVSFNDDLSVGVPLNEDRSGGEGLLQRIKGILTLISPSPRGGLARQPSKRNCDVRVVRDETTVEVGKSEERLYVLYLSRSWPFQDRPDFLRGHAEALRREDET